MIVVDASVFLASVLEDEMPDTSRVLGQGLCTGSINIFIPSIFHYEVANAFLMSLRRKRISQPVYERYIALVAGFPAEVDNDQKIEEVSSLAFLHDLTIYDAAYVETAKRHHLPLATFDKAMHRAATKEKLPLVF